jgi:hypothetical protein
MKVEKNIRNWEQVKTLVKFAHGLSDSYAKLSKQLNLDYSFVYYKCNKYSTINS